MSTPSWFRTSRHVEAEGKVREAIGLIATARETLTIWEFEEFVRENIATLGSHGFISSIGEALTKAATIEATLAIANKDTSHDG